jgi:hypothetical protein
MISAEEIASSSERDGPDFILGKIVVELYSFVVQILHHIPNAGGQHLSIEKFVINCTWDAVYLR